MNYQKNRIDEYFSTEGLISALSELDVSKDPVEINVEIDFKDATVVVKGRIWGYFHEQQLSNDTPQYTDLYDVGISLSSINISYGTEYFEKRVRSLILN